MIILGLTGSIGCGKSSLSNILRDNNINIIDADIISRKIFEDEKNMEMDYFDPRRPHLVLSAGSGFFRIAGN